MQDRKRKNWLDAAKGLSMVLIMMSHSCGFPVASKFFLAGFVAIFFFLSGYTYTPRGSFGESINKKAKSLLIPYFFYGILAIFAIALFTYVKGGDWIGYGKNESLGLLYSRYSMCRGGGRFFLKGGLEPMWFLTCMFLSFIWVELYVRTRSKYRFLLVLCYLFLTYAFSFSSLLLPWSFDTTFIGAVLIILGYETRLFLGKQKESVCVKKISGSIWLQLLLIGISVGVLFFLAYFFGEGNFSLGDYGKYGMFGILSFLLEGVLKAVVIGGVFFILGEISIITKLFAFIGKQSLRLMCTHYCVFVLIGATINRTYLYAVVGMALALVLSLAFEWIGEKTKIIQSFRYI